MNDEYITLNEAAEILEVKKPNLYRLAKSGKVPIYKKGSHSFAKREEVLRYKKENEEIKPLY